MPANGRQYDRREADAVALRQQRVASTLRRLAVGGFGLALTACVAPAPTGSAIGLLPVPKAWSGSIANSDFTRPATPLAEWWRRFDDPLLVELIGEALRSNTSVRGAMGALAESRASAAVQSAGLLPNLFGTASAQRSRIGHAAGANTFTAGFDAGWEPDIFGGLHAAVSAADADTQASNASLGDVQTSVAAEVAVDYLLLRGLQARLVIAKNNLAIQEETLQLTRWRNQAGLLTALEVEQARADMEQTHAQIPVLRSAAMQSEHSLEVLTWHAPRALHDRLAQSDGSSETPKAPADDLVLAFPADTLRQRPDVRAAEARMVAAVFRVRQANAARFPTFQLGGSLGLSSSTLGSLASGSSVATTVLNSATLPIFDGGALRAQVRVQQALLLQAGATYDAVVVGALQDVENSLVALRNDRGRLESLRAAADAAHTAALLAVQRFSSGLIDFQVVLDTQRTALVTEDAMASTAADLNADHVRLYKALGGGWENIGTPVPLNANGLPTALSNP